MKRIISLILAVVMILGSMSALSSCGAPKNDGAEISVYLGDAIFDFDPSDYYVSTNAELVLNLIYEPLFTLNSKGKIQCAAAKSYEVDEEEREIVIEIRETYWSDDIQLKASDFVYAWCERIISASTPNPAAPLFYDIEGVKEVVNGKGTTSDVGIKATEMQQITITYCDGADYESILRNLASVATAPVRQDIVETAVTNWSKSSNTIVTNGHFRVKAFNRETGEFQLTRNLGYRQLPTVKDYDNKVNPGLIYTTFKTTNNNVTVSYEDIAEKVVFIMAEASLADRAEYAKKAKVADHTSTYTYVFNTTHPLFADVNVRKALSAVIDREAIIEAIVFGKAADGFLPDISGGSDVALISTTANKVLAQKYLSKVSPSLIAENKSFTLTINNDEQSVKIASIVEQAWESLGFDVTVEALSTVTNQLVTSIDPTTKEPQYTDVVDSGIQYLVKEASYGKRDFDVIAIDWQTYSYDPVVGLATLTTALSGMGRDFYSGDVELGEADYSAPRLNISGWYDGEYDMLVSAIYGADKDDQSREFLIDAAESYLIENMPVCPLVFNQNFIFKSSKISNLKFDGLGNFTLGDVKLSNYKKFYKPEEEND